MYCRKVILLLESEIELLRIRHFPPNTSLNSLFKNRDEVYFIPKSDGLGIDSIGEFASSLELSYQFLDKDGNPAPFIHIAKALESAFNFTFGDAYKSKNRIFNRKPYNLTKALDYMKNLIIRASRRKKMKKDEFVNT